MKKLQIHGDCESTKTLTKLFEKHYKIVESNPDFTINLNEFDTYYPYLCFDTSNEEFICRMLKEVRQLHSDEMLTLLLLGLTVRNDKMVIVNFPQNKSQMVEKVVYRTLLHVL